MSQAERPHSSHTAAAHDPPASDGAQGCASSAHLIVTSFAATSPLYGQTPGSARVRQTHGAGLPPRAPHSSVREGPGGVLGTMEW